MPPAFLLIISIYLLINIAYSFFLKHIAIIDIVCIAAGFVLRIFAGGVSANIDNSHWIVIMTFLLAIFLALAKRRDDILLAANGNDTRKNIKGYNLEFVSSGMMVMASVIIVSYILYTVSPEVTAKHGTNQLYLTSFWVIIGILRYMQITLVEERSGSPTMLLLKDIFLQTVVILWILNSYIIIYPW
jgi:4-hydroxybenzoate polyprenyltransferase